MRNPHKCVCAFTAREGMFLFHRDWWSTVKSEGLCWKCGIRRTTDTWTQTRKVQKTPKVPLYLNFSKLQIKVHLVDMVKIFNFESLNISNVGRPNRASPLPAWPHVSSQLRSSFFFVFLCPCTRSNRLDSPTGQLVKA